MAKKQSDYNRVLAMFTELKKLYPTYSIGRHVSGALSEYGDSWGMTDKEFLFALEKYRADMEFNAPDEEDIARIVNDAKDLDKLFREEEEEE